MRAIRTVVAVGAVASGFASGWLTSRAGGSVERAPGALMVMVAALGGTALCVGLVFGLFNDPAATVAVSAMTLVSHYAATWAFSPFHSVAGDVLFMILSGVPAALVAVVGFLVGRALTRLSRT